MRRKAQPAFEWSDGRDRFERAVEILVQRQHPHDDVRVIDGRGGDDGKDVEVLLGDGTRVVYQLKYFPEGFSGPFVKRRSQIRDSFATAQQNPPDRWILVTPNKLTPPEWSYVTNLGKGTPTTITVWDRSRLDSLLARHPDVVDFLQRDDDLLSAAALLQQEQAVLAHPATDLPERVQALGRQVDGLDPYYSLAFMRVGSTTTSFLQAKHPRAHEIQPVTIKFNAVLAAEDDARQPLERLLGYGSRETVELTGDQVEGFTVTGTPLLADPGPVGKLVILPVDPDGRKPTTCLLEAKGCDGGRLRQYRGTITHHGTGRQGDSLDLEFYGIVTLKLRLPQDRTQRVSMDYDFRAEQASPTDLAAAASLSLMLQTAHSLTLTAEDGTPFLTINPAGQGDHEQWRQHMQVLQETAEDFDRVQRETDTDLAMPTTIRPIERVFLRIVRRAYEGELSLHPTMDSVTVTVPTSGTREAQVLLDGQARAIFFEQDRNTVVIGERSLDVTGLSFWHPSMALKATIDERAELLARLTRGEETTLTFTSQDGTNIRVYMRARRTHSADEPAPWGLTGIAEPPSG